MHWPPNVPRAKADVTHPENHSRSYLFAESCPRGAERFISRRERVKAKHSLTHQDESVGSVFSWRQPLLTMQFNKQFKDCDDLVLNENSCFLEGKEYMFFFQIFFFSALNLVSAGHQGALSRDRLWPLCTVGDLLILNVGMAQWEHHPVLTHLCRPPKGHCCRTP